MTCVKFGQSRRFTLTISVAERELTQVFDLLVAMRPIGALMKLSKSQAGTLARNACAATVSVRQRGPAGAPLLKVDATLGAVKSFVERSVCATAMSHGPGHHSPQSRHQPSPENKKVSRR